MHCNECRWVLAGLLACSMMSAEGQTIGDYSRAQAAALERNMMQTIRRPLSASDPSSLPSPSTLLAPSSPPAAVAAASERAGSEPRQGLRRARPVMLVSGMFVTRARTIVEITVDGSPYWLSEGDAIPHTTWSLRSVAPTGVELEDHPTSGERASRKRAAHLSFSR